MHAKDNASFVSFKFWRRSTAAVVTFRNLDVDVLLSNKPKVDIDKIALCVRAKYLRGR